MKPTVAKMVAKTRQPITLVVFALISIASAASYGLLTLFHDQHHDVSNDATARLIVFMAVGSIVIVLYLIALTVIQKMLAMSQKSLLYTGLATIVLCSAMLICYPIAIYSGQPYELCMFANDPNSFSTYTTTVVASVITLLIVGAIVSRHAIGVHREAVKRIPAQTKHTYLVVLCVVIVLAIMAAPWLLYLIPVMILSSLGLGNLFASPGAFATLFLLLIAVWIACVVTALRDLKKSQSAKAVAYRAGLVWVLFSLAISIQIVWVIYMWVAVSLWPLKTISPSGK